MSKKKDNRILAKSGIVVIGLAVLILGVLVGLGYSFITSGKIMSGLSTANAGTLISGDKANFDSSIFLAQTGASGSYYTRTCTWVSYLDLEDVSIGEQFGDWNSGEFWPQDEFNLGRPCTDKLGNFNVSPYDVPASCESGDDDLGIYCYITDIDTVEPLMEEIEPTTGIVDYTPFPGNYEGTDYLTGGACYRLCRTPTV